MRPFSNFKKAFARLGLAYFCAAISLVANKYLPPLYQLEPEFNERSVIFKMWYSFDSLRFMRVANLLSAFMCYEAWLVASGISYRAKKDNVPEEFNSLRCGKFRAIIFID